MKRTTGVLLATLAVFFLFIVLSNSSHAGAPETSGPANDKNRTSGKPAQTAPTPPPRIAPRFDDYENEDPDLPKHGPRIDKERYLELRNEYFARLRGFN